MFTYLHCYLPQTWEGQVKAGLIDEHAGIRFCESIDVEEPLKFNPLAAKGGALWNLLKETRMPLYIDRLQGGCYIEKYPYDMALIQGYRDMLGENFWGFQMHEWMSNYSSDLAKITRNHCTAWTEEAITQAILREFKFPHLFLEVMDAKEFAALGHAPQNAAEFLEHCRWIFGDRQAYTGGMLLPCDSFCQANALELNMGAKRLMPEIGAQTADARIQLAYARGMTSTRKLPFGAYYEPWGGNPFSTCNYHRQGLNEWGIYGDSFPFSAAGGNGGSSRSLQMRLHLFAYMAGASFMAEEWGMSNTFYDWQDFELTPYGQVKLDFLNFTRKYPQIGRPVVPMAIVLPKELEVLESLHVTPDTYLGFAAEGVFKQKLRQIRESLAMLYRDQKPLAGSEPLTLTHGALPDGMDIVREDFLEEGKYAYLVDLTGNPAFAKAHANTCTAEEAPALMNRALPCEISGDAHTMLTQSDDGSYYFLAMNHAGVARSVAEGEKLLPGNDRVITVHCKNRRQLQALEGNGTLHTEGDTAFVTLPAGGWFFGKF